MAPVFVLLGAAWVVAAVAKGAAEGAAANRAAATAQPVVVVQPQPMIQPVDATLLIERMRNCTTTCTGPNFCNTTCM